MTDLSLNIPDTGKPRVVVVGGGFGGLYTVKKLKRQGFQVVLFDKRNYHTFQPLLYQVSTAGLQPDSIVGPLRTIYHGYPDGHFRMVRILSVDPARNTVHTIAGDLRYDYLVISNGMKSNFFGNDNFRQFTLPVKSIPDALNLRSHIMQLFERAVMTSDPELLERIMTIVIVGAGPTGVETAGALSELRKYVLPKDYPNLDFSRMKIYVIEGLDRVLPPMSPASSARAHKDLERMGVEVRLNTFVSNYDGDILTFKNGETLRTATVVWSAGVMGDVIDGIPREWVERGRILTDRNCRAIGSSNIFAIGDVAMMKTDKYPKGHPGVAQPAIQMGKYVGKQLKDIHAGKAVPGFEYFDKGTLATIGRGKAVADLLGDKLHLGGRIAWYIWLFVHITYLISFRNRILVLANWWWNFWTYDKGNRLIIRPYILKNDPVGQEVAEADVED
ncbi:MAG TPA: NAD(P)/FAD-dependent oxidoreductase [Dinghuibacter sp.]|jgi:NADH dehydrogenase|uniref:NAD(P)/FAD-dependent oxidoreductase n=1 Tax=Dinghuibacter sp. TaxID=2024697 RepID=UPI002CE118EF|nr:NAD(P)/FAD-dependent oxidoreductase [Dinghuibacter sp.]HTJ14127.1 NAD(P)/FAD-dependent oxidoreductase [Dinghuibacter sp.]